MGQHISAHVEFQLSAHKGGSCNNRLLRRVLRRIFKGRRRLVRVSVETGVLRRGCAIEGA